MTQPYKLRLMLSDAHWKPFHRLLDGQRTSIDMLHAWLKRRGYQLSRSTVGLYARRHRDFSLHSIRDALGGKSDTQLRSLITRRADHLAGRELLMLATLAELLASAGTEPGGRKTVPSGRLRRAVEGR